MTQAEKALAVHDYIVLNCQYNWYIATTSDNPYDKTKYSENVFNAYGALVDKNAVCQGYAEAFNLIMKKLNCPAYMVTSTGHAWSMIQLDGQWYNVDATWDDPVPDKAGYCSHNFFLCSDEKLLELDSGGSHIRESRSVGLPACNGTAFSNSYIIKNAINSVCWYNNQFYYISKNNSGSNVLTYSRLNSEDNEISVVSASEGLIKDSFGGFFLEGSTRVYRSFYTMWNWCDGTLVYLSAAGSNSYEIWLYDLENEENRKVSETFSFTPAASPMGEYAVAYDAIGIAVDAQAGTASAVSSTRRTTLATANILNFPAVWTVDETMEVQLCGIRNNGDGTLTAGVYSKNGGNYLLVSASYKSGRMLDVRLVASSVSTGRQLLTFSKYTQADETRLFCVSSSGVPLCENLELAA